MVAIQCGKPLITNTATQKQTTNSLTFLPVAKQTSMPQNILEINKLQKPIDIYFVIIAAAGLTSARPIGVASNKLLSNKTPKKLPNQ